MLGLNVGQGYMKGCLMIQTKAYGRKVNGVVVKGIHNPFLCNSIHKLVEAPVAGFISKVLRVTACNFKDFDDLFVCVM